MSVLKRLPCDGTFDQEGPINKLASSRPMKVYSFDLKSATDRWPLSIIYDVMSLMFGPTCASSIVNGSLSLNAFLIGPPMVRRPSLVCFQAGQPLGYYGSWADSFLPVTPFSCLGGSREGLPTYGKGIYQVCRIRGLHCYRRYVRG